MEKEGFSTTALILQGCVPPPKSRLERLIWVLYQDDRFAQTYPLIYAYPALENLFYDGNELDGEALLRFLSYDIRKGHKNRFNPVFLDAVMLGFVKIGILKREIEEGAAYAVCHEGIGGKGTYASYLNLGCESGFSSLFIADKDNAYKMYYAIRKIRHQEGRTVYLNQIVHLDGMYRIMTIISSDKEKNT